ncbi:unnamed protein product [Ranitomeya imitator]|uniref:Helix-turn-helix domain-containing protein n=1 Tax=Ranitomeya imitator TaxID=111125 RepID=A0ABN9L322_9NEOB|nr:unnamed protein product [Ranitomeya imitator]
MKTKEPTRQVRDKVEKSKVGLCISALTTSKKVLTEGTLSGTAMGARCAPSFANLFMGWWEETSVYPSRAFRENVLYWFRFIDDIFFIWAGSREGCEDFLRMLNDNVYNIYLTFEISLSTVGFLDLRLIRQNDIIYTDLFRKNTAANGLLDFKSFHPHHLKKNLPTGQFHRIRRNCTLQSDFCSQAKALSTRLQARGYPRSIIKNALQQTKSIPRTQLLKPRNRKVDNELRYITTFHNHWKEVSELFRRHWNILKTDPKNPAKTPKLWSSENPTSDKNGTTFLSQNSSNCLLTSLMSTDCYQKKA